MITFKDYFEILKLLYDSYSFYFVIITYYLCIYYFKLLILF